MKKIILLLIVSFTAIASFAQAEQMEAPYAKKGMLILLSTKSYAAAIKLAQQAKSKLSLTMDLRGLKPNKKNGLTYSEADCENEGGYPCYIARGRYDDGEFISIEYSNAIEGFAKGYYIVVAACGDKEITAPALVKAKKEYKDAYVKNTSVYMGCMH
jgi:hypothetical protein